MGWGWGWGGVVKTYIQTYKGVNRKNEEKVEKWIKSDETVQRMKRRN